MGVSSFFVPTEPSTGFPSPEISVVGSILLF